jgi:hypothetical protein
MRKLKSILKGIALGGLKAVPLLGGIAEEVKKSVESEEAHSPKGQVDYARLLGYGIVGVIILAVIFGKIDIETAKELIKKLNLFSFFS